MRGRVMMDMISTKLGRFEILHDHGPAAAVSDDLPVAHAVTLAHCALRKVLMRVVMRLTLVMRCRAVMHLGITM